MGPFPDLPALRGCMIGLLILFWALLPEKPLAATAGSLEPLRLSLRAGSDQGPECEQHAAPRAGKAEKAKTAGGRPAVSLESEHRPVGQRTYYLNACRRLATIKAYVRRPDGRVIEPELSLGYNAHVSFSTPLGRGPAHGANNVYVVEQGVEDQLFVIRTAKWITMHHNCGWGHDSKFDKSLTTPQPLAAIPFEIVIDRLWDTNFHLGISSGDSLAITVLSSGTPVAGATVTVSSAKGWSKQVVTGRDGKVSVEMIRDYHPPRWSVFDRTHRGEFLVTARYAETKQGSFKGNSYQRVSYITTLPWQYSPSARDYSSYGYGLAIGFFSMSFSGFGVFLYRERRRKTYKGISFDE